MRGKKGSVQANRAQYCFHGITAASEDTRPGRYNLISITICEEAHAHTSFTTNQSIDVRTKDATSVGIEVS